MIVNCYLPRITVLKIAAVCLLCIHFPSLVSAQDTPVSSNASTPASTPELDEEPTEVHCGIDGVYRASQWTLFRTLDPSAKITSVETLDGDGVRVKFVQPEANTRNVSYAVPGGAYGPLSIRSTNATLYDGRLSGRPIEPNVPWVVVFGDSLGVEAIGKNELLGKEATVAVSVIDEAQKCPDRRLGFSGVDLVIIGAGGIPVLSQMSSEQSHAIVDYVMHGGRLLVHFGENVRGLMDAAPWIQELAPIDASAAPIQLDPAAIETFMSSQSRLETLTGAVLPSKGGTPLISGRTTNRQPARIAVELTAGFGRVTLASMALDSPTLKTWPQHTLLVNRLSGNLFANEIDARRDSKDNSSVGYNDFAGQIRAALDRFELRRRVPYSVVSLILLALATLIGPIDYLVVNRLIGRPLVGWITFPLTVFSFVALILVASGRVPGMGSEPDPENQVYVNQIDITDLDLTGSVPRGRGWAWSQLHGISAQQIRLGATFDERWSNPSPTAPITAPFGYPSETFGGIAITGEDVYTPAYTVQLYEGPDGLWSQVSDIPLPPGGSKGLVSTWEFKPKIVGKSELRRKRGSELLEGAIANPLEVDIYNGVLVFGEWVYILPSRFRPGQTIDNIETLRQKNFRWLLARREALENSSRSEPWNPTMYDDTQRMAELLMFSDISGGREYTGLGNRPLKFLDLGHMLGPQQAILFGQVKEPQLEVDLPTERVSTSVVRAILNVDLPRLSN